TVGIACTPENTCHAGAIACDSGAPACVDTQTPALVGTPCEDGKVCDASGQCVACADGLQCEPAACHLGVVGCWTGGGGCRELGTCSPCADGAICPLAACRLGALACDTGAGVCEDLGLVELAGTTCGDSKVCDASGHCNTCAAGGSCVPANVCRKGAVSCDTG